MSTALTAEVLRNVVLVSSFRGTDLDRCQAAFLLILRLQVTADAGMIPAETLTNSKTGQFDPQLAGMACASLVAQRLIESVGRVRSSSPLANGRKVNNYHIPADRQATVRTWLARRGYLTETQQQELKLA